MQQKKRERQIRSKFKSSTGINQEKQDRRWGETEESRGPEGTNEL